MRRPQSIGLHRHAVASDLHRRVPRSRPSSVARMARSYGALPRAAACRTLRGTSSVARMARSLYVGSLA